MSKEQNKWSFKRLTRELVIMVVIVFVVSTVLNIYRAPKLDSNMLPEIKVTLIDGTIFDTAKSNGKPVMVNFWGTWCPICAQEASNIDFVSKDYTVLTIAVNSRSNDHIKKWLTEHDVSYPTLNDANGKWAEQFDVSIYPTTFIYDSHGKLKFTETGYSTTAGLIARMKMAE